MLLSLAFNLLVGAEQEGQESLSGELGSEYLMVKSGGFTPNDGGVFGGFGAIAEEDIGSKLQIGITKVFSPQDRPGTRVRKAAHKVLIWILVIGFFHFFAGAGQDELEPGTDPEMAAIFEQFDLRGTGIIMLQKVMDAQRVIRIGEQTASSGSGIGNHAKFFCQGYLSLSAASFDAEQCFLIDPAFANGEAVLQKLLRERAHHEIFIARELGDCGERASGLGHWTLSQHFAGDDEAGIVFW